MNVGTLPITLTTTLAAVRWRIPLVGFATLRQCELDEVQWTVGSIHDLRRTWATEMATHVDILTLCRWGGWADSKTAQQFYHEVKSETADRARKAMADLYRETDAQLTRKVETESLTAAG